MRKSHFYLNFIKFQLNQNYFKIIEFSQENGFVILKA